MIRLFFMFFKISALALGGGYAMIPVMLKNLTSYNILSEEEFKEILSIAQAMPGPIAFKVSWLIGKKINGIKGSLVTSLGVLIPPFFSIVLIATILKKYSNNNYVLAFTRGAYASLVGMVAGILYDFIKTTKTNIYDIFIIIFSTLIMFVYPKYTVIVFFSSIILFYFLEKGYGKNA
ncbi:chromate transporter [Marinitoga litoralis]|uniref:chromate transporter n=1 Tax=Marinitoga litoralis TaxID=570855 RepID=UPI00195FF718|nr:chromate transporter [Marinitoga litoralis]MBM7559333.1 chromate transporter [Marinitoga litoralis]